MGQADSRGQGIPALDLGVGLGRHLARVEGIASIHRFKKDRVHADRGQAIEEVSQACF
jgi:hypothetical protein